MSELTPREQAQALTIRDLSLRLEEAEEILAALRRGEVDALVVKPGDAPQIWSLNGVEQIYRVLFETLNEGALTLDAEGTILYSNGQFAALIGRPLQTVLGSSFEELVAPPDRPAYKALLADGLKLRSKGELPLVRPDGERVCALVSFHALDIEPIGASCTAVVSDLTELKHAQSALAEANEDLEARVEERTAALKAEMLHRELLAEQLRDANRRKNEFLAMLGHELRNPLAPITNAVEMIRLQSDKPEIERSRRVIERQIRHIARLVDDLLDVSRITRGLIEVRKERIDLKTVISSAVSACRPTFEAAQHQLALRLPKEPCWVLGDATRLEQVVVNLLSNAAKYSPSPGNVCVTLRREGEWAELSVRDEGRGIPPAMLPRIFELFAQADTTIDRSLGGLGIGLTVVRSLVNLHGGSVSARSGGAGHGSEFIVCLPALSAEAPEHLDEPPAAQSATRPMRVMVVEDNVDSAETLAELMAIWGHEVRVASHGTAALEIAGTFLPEVVLLDIGLPGMDGYQVASRLRDLPSGAGVPAGGDTGTPQSRSNRMLVVAMTGYGQDEDRRRSMAAGVDIHLTKPVNPEHLHRVLSRAATRSASQEQTGQRADAGALPSRSN